MPSNEPEQKDNNDINVVIKEHQFPSKDRLELALHYPQYAGFVPKHALVLYYLEYDEFGYDGAGTSHFNVVCEEHFKLEDMPSALSAFETRLNSDSPHRFSEDLRCSRRVQNVFEQVKVGDFANMQS